MRIHILALDEVFDTGLSTLLDTLNIANDLAGSVDALSTRFDVTVIGMRRRIRTRHGFTVPAVAASRTESPDVVLVPALGAKTPETLELALKREDVGDGLCHRRDDSEDDTRPGHGGGHSSSDWGEGPKYV